MDMGQKPKLRKEPLQWLKWHCYAVYAFVFCITFGFIEYYVMLPCSKAKIYLKRKFGFK